VVVRLGLKPEGRGQSAGGGQVDRWRLEWPRGGGSQQPGHRAASGQGQGTAGCSQHSKGEASLMKEREFVSRNV
jgi:hypothetical protein